MSNTLPKETKMEQATCRVGVARKKITPPLGSELTGYAHKRFATDIKSDLYTKALVIEAGGRCIALVCNDLLLTHGELADPARERIAAACGIPAEAVLIAASHTHTGPELIKRSIFVDPVPGCLEIVTDAIVGAVKDACDSMFDATLHFGHVEAPGYSINKLSRTKDGHDVYRHHLSFGPGEIGPSGPLDMSVQVLCARDMDKRIRSLTVNFAAHPDSSGDSIWAEWPGEMAQTLAAVYGADVPCLFLQGTAGDVNCMYGISREQVGRGIAGAAIMAIEREAALLTPVPIDFRLKRLKIPRLVKTPETDRMIDAIREKASAGYLEKAWLAAYDAWKAEPVELEAVVQCLRLGDAALITLPGEAFTNLGLEIKRYSPAKRTFVVTCANAWVGYIPPVEQAERGGYGEWPFLSRRLIPEAATMMTNTIIEMLHEMWNKFPKNQ